MLHERIYVVKGEGKKKYIYMQYSIFGNSMIRNGSNLVESSFIWIPTRRRIYGKRRRKKKERKKRTFNILTLKRAAMDAMTRGEQRRSNVN